MQLPLRLTGIVENETVAFLFLIVDTYSHSL